MLELADACVAAVSNALHVELDYTQDTLPLLDHYLTQARGPREEILNLVAPMCGAYFGEVLLRSLGPARWHAPDGDYPDYRLEFETVFLHFNPIGVALEAMLEQPIVGYGATLGLRERERLAVEKAVELYGDVREDDYYRLAIRYEVIEQAVETLRSVQPDENGAEVSSEAYELAVSAAREATIDREKSDVGSSV